MSTFAKILAATATGFFIVYFVLFAMPSETDNCTPNLIARYTNVIISHKDCIALGAQCIITPTDVRKFNNSRTRLQECIIEIGGGEKEE